MRTGVFLFGAVEMGALGESATPPTQRRYQSPHIMRATERLLQTGVLADELGYDSFWMTEHHFQHEGYEVVPNGILLSAFLAERTQNLRIGTMFNVLGQWHPLRLAEDFATLHNLSGGRAVLGLGRGTVPREMEPLSLGRSSVASVDNPQETADAVNRALFDESVDLLLAALNNETFCHRGRNYQAPPRGIPDRGGEVESLSLVPRPLYPYEIWQATTSPATLQAVPERGFGSVFWLLNRELMIKRWEIYRDVYEKAHGRSLEPGENRMAVLNVHIADSHEQAIREARDGHDEFWRFLGPYGWNRGYLGPDGSAPPAGWIPALEDSMAQGQWLVGTADEVGGHLDKLAGAIDLENLTLFPSMPGDSYDRAADQLHRFAADVAPGLPGSTPKQVSISAAALHR